MKHHTPGLNTHEWADRYRRAAFRVAAAVAELEKVAADPAATRPGVRPADTAYIDLANAIERLSRLVATASRRKAKAVRGGT